MVDPQAQHAHRPLLRKHFVDQAVVRALDARQRIRPGRRLTDTGHDSLQPAGSNRSRSRQLRLCTRRHRAAVVDR